MYLTAAAPERRIAEDLPFLHDEDILADLFKKSLFQILKAGKIMAFFQQMKKDHGKI